MPHLALGSDSKHNIPHHGAVVHNTQTGEHHQVHHQPEHHQPEHKEEDSDSEEEEEEEVTKEEVMNKVFGHFFPKKLIKELHSYLPEKHPLQKSINKAIKEKGHYIDMSTNDIDYITEALKENNQNDKYDKDIKHYQQRKKEIGDNYLKWQ